MLEVEEQLLPRSCALAHAVGEADQLLLALRCGANNDQQALRIVFQPGLNMNAVDPEIDVAFGREVALAPAPVLFRPSLLETPYGRGRKPAGVQLAPVVLAHPCATPRSADDGRKRLVRHGHLPEREIMTGIGPVGVRCPRVRDRVGEGSQRIRFSSAILPPYARRSKSLEVLIPILYLKGISTGDFEEALVALLGKDAGGLSASTVGRLKEAWSEEHTRWSKRDLSAKRYVYFWVDGIHVQARLEDDAQCLLVVIGATLEGKKELVGLIDGVRESAQSWRELLLDLKRRGLAMGPEIAVADGALGFWQAIEEVWPQTRGQRCWVHKTANILNKLPKSQQSKAKRALQEIWMAETKKDALAAFDTFIETWGVKYDKAVECLIKDRDALLAFLRL